MLCWCDSYASFRWRGQTLSKRNATSKERAFEVPLVPKEMQNAKNYSIDFLVCFFCVVFDSSDSFCWRGQTLVFFSLQAPHQFAHLDTLLQHIQVFSEFPGALFKRHININYHITMCFLKVSDAFSVPTPIGPLGHEKKNRSNVIPVILVCAAVEKAESLLLTFFKSQQQQRVCTNHRGHRDRRDRTVYRNHKYHRDHSDHRATLLFFSGQVGKVACLLEKSPKPCKTFFFSTTTQMEILLWRFKRRLETWRMLLFD